MKGIILAAGRGSRLYPCTKIINKVLLPVYNRPMIYYPLNTLLQAGISDILIIINPDDRDNFYNLLGDGQDYHVRITYAEQIKPRGIAEAFIIGEQFIGQDNVTLVLGDNIFVDDTSAEIKNFTSGGKVFAKEVSDPRRFGVVEINEVGQAISIEEKPLEPKSNLALTGLYIYDHRVIEVAKTVQPSQRGELEVTDLHQWYMERGELEVKIINKDWVDAGTFDSLLEAQIIAKDQLQSLMRI